MTSPTVSGDPEARAVYIKLTDSEISETLELSRDVYLDIDAEGRPAGFEILNASEDLLSSVPPLPATTVLKDLLKSQDT